MYEQPRILYESLCSAKKIKHITFKLKADMTVMLLFNGNKFITEGRLNSLNSPWSKQILSGSKSYIYT